MVVIPLVVSAIVIGVTSIGDNKQLSKFGSKMILYYGIITVAAVVIGTALALVMHPGNGAAHYITENAAAEVQTTVATAMDEQQGNLLNMFLGFIESPINAGAAAMVAGLAAVPVVSLLTPKMEKEKIEEIFQCYDETVTITKKRSLQQDL